MVSKRIAPFLAGDSLLENKIVDNGPENYNESEADTPIAENGSRPKSVEVLLLILALGWNR
jgi:hypothetical protein